MVARLASLDDLAPGQSFELGTLSLSLAEIVAFASRYDAQPFHLDEAAAATSLFRTLVASGLHTLSAVFGHVIASGLISEISLGGNQMDVKWPAALRPDEEVAVRVEVLDVRPSASRPALGVARLRYLATRIADGVVVLDATGTHFLKR
ncbi:acyl dehydratase [Humitalea rosea]|uniref:Acyl dehydratase n=1 Tax=Humitalea rosea TaxID=990373 RepID=A0A2W7IDC9_9PROT|nr:MaoC/PaaZ C-terminal domain-containing protein [Humitalea rosea]PZW44966.1 acyl dehydratase [Humitalea rosea]